MVEDFTKLYFLTLFILGIMIGMGYELDLIGGLQRFAWRCLTTRRGYYAPFLVLALAVTFGPPYGVMQ